MPAYHLLTFADLIDHAIDWMGVDPGREALRDARRAAQLALSDLATDSQWVYYLNQGRIALSAPYTTGTISYDHSGGASDRLVTLDSGTWPDWAWMGTLLVGNTPYEVQARLGDTQLTLTSSSNPGDDLAAGTSYTLYQDTYALPADFLSLGTVVLENNAVVLCRDNPQAGVERRRIYRGVAQPRFYSIVGSPDHLTGLGLNLFPPPDDDYALAFLYQRRPRPMRVERYATGTASVTSGQATVTGSGTAWSSGHVGCVFRPSQSSAAVTGPFGSNPAGWERVVTAVASATSLTLDAAAPESLSGVAYHLSDPVDIELGAMRTALLRGVEKQASMSRRGKDRELVEAAYDKALIRAREADSRNFRQESAGPSGHWPARLADMPSGPDE